MEVTALLRESMKSKKDKGREGRRVCSTPGPEYARMNYNESLYGMSPRAKEAFAACIENGKYYGDWFCADLRRSIAGHYGLSIDQVAVGSGSSALIDMIGAVFFNPGDEVVLCEPTFGALRSVIDDNGAKAVSLPLTADYRFDLDAMAAAVTEKTKLVIVCNPNNPTGTMRTGKEVEQFIAGLPKQVLVLVDEAYIDFVDDPEETSMMRLVRDGAENVMVMRTFSKIYGMAGIRIGYITASVDVIDQLMKTSSSWNVSAPGQACALAAFEDQAYIQDVKQKLTEGRAVLTEGLKKLGCDVVPSCTNFIYFDTHRPAAEISAKLAQHKVLISTFAMSRVTVSTPENNARFLKALEESLKEA